MERKDLVTSGTEKERKGRKGKGWKTMMETFNLNSKQINLWRKEEDSRNTLAFSENFSISVSCMRGRQRGRERLWVVEYHMFGGKAKNLYLYEMAADQDDCHEQSTQYDDHDYDACWTVGEEKMEKFSFDLNWNRHQVGFGRKSQDVRGVQEVPIKVEKVIIKGGTAGGDTLRVTWLSSWLLSQKVYLMSLIQIMVLYKYTTSCRTRKKLQKIFLHSVF